MTPLADLVVTSHAKSFFLQRNEETLAAEDQPGLQRLKRSRSMHEFHQHMHVFDGKVGDAKGGWARLSVGQWVTFLGLRLTLLNNTKQSTTPPPPTH